MTETAVECFALFTAKQHKNPILNIAAQYEKSQGSAPTVGHLQSMLLDWRVRVALGSTVVRGITKNHKFPNVM